MDRIANAQQCPYCRGWIVLPLRRARAAFDTHKLRCRASVPGAVQVPPFDPSCGLCGANIVVDPFHHCPPAERADPAAVGNAAETLLTLSGQPTQGVMFP